MSRLNDIGVLFSDVFISNYSEVFLFIMTSMRQQNEEKKLPRHLEIRALHAFFQ